jgi:hypothetical protein
VWVNSEEGGENYNYTIKGDDRRIIEGNLANFGLKPGNYKDDNGEICLSVHGETSLDHHFNIVNDLGVIRYLGYNEEKGSLRTYGIMEGVLGISRQGNRA